MVIGVNARFLLDGKLEGIGWFCHEILKRWVQDHPEHEFVFFFDRPFSKEFIYGSNVKGVVVMPPARSVTLWKIWFDIAIPRSLKKHKIDVFVSMDGYCSLRTPIKQLLVVHDLAFEHDAFGLAKKFVTYYKKYTPKFVAKASKVATVSGYSADDISERYKIKRANIDVVYDGYNEEFSPFTIEERIQVKNEYTAGFSYFLSLGAIHPRKNTLGLIKAFEQFKNATDSSNKLLIVGRMAWSNGELTKYLENCKYCDDIIFIGNQSFAQVKRIVAGANALIYPSFFEGFGIPILEAMACNVPVISSNTSSMPEVVGQAGILIDPNRPEEIADAMEKLEKDQEYRANLIDLGAQQKALFSWDKTAALLWNSLEEII